MPVTITNPQLVKMPGCYYLGIGKDAGESVDQNPAQFENIFAALEKTHVMRKRLQESHSQEQ